MIRNRTAAVAVVGLLGGLGCSRSPSPPDVAPPPAPSTSSGVLAALRPLTDASVSVEAGAPRSGPFATPRAFDVESGYRVFALAFVPSEGGVTAYVRRSFALGLEVLPAQVAGNVVRVEAKGKGGEVLTRLVGSVGPDGRLTGTLFDGAAKETRSFVGKPTPPPGDLRKVVYRGTLGTHSRITLELAGGPEPTQAKGRYRYAKSQTDLTLEGLIDPKSGAFDLVERDQGKRETGRLRGVLFGSNVGVGTWSSADGARTMPLRFAEGGVYPEAKTFPGDLVLTPVEDTRDIGRSCFESFSYPQIRGGVPKDTALTLNAALRDAFVPTEKERAKASECQEDPEIAPNTLEVSYGLELVAPGWLALERSSYAFTGGAHGMGNIACLAVDLAKARVMPVRELLPEASRGPLGALATASWKRELGDASAEDSMFSVSRLEVTDTTELCLRRDGLAVQYQPYELGAYALGAPSFVIPKAEARRLFPPERARELFP